MEIVYTILLGAGKLALIAVFIIPFCIRFVDMESYDVPSYRKPNANILEKIYFLYYPNVVGYSLLVGLICGIFYLTGKII